MYAFPPNVSPPDPFPPVLAQTAAREFVAPGVSRAEIRLQTSAGPLCVHVVAVDTTEPTVRLGVVLAHDRLVSSGETVSSMAVRTGAVAGVNADYFDIGNTNQPLNIVVQGGQLVRSPSNRVALFVGTDKRVYFANAAFHGDVRYGGADVPLTGVNVWPPQGGASLMTPAYGAPVPQPSISTVGIVPTAPGQYRATDLAGPGGPPFAASLAFGPAAAAVATPPPAGATLEMTMTLEPELDRIAEAAGGGPLLVVNSRPVSDPNAPAPEERDIRFPVSGAGLAADGTLLLVAADGRLPAESIGLTRPEFGALMLGLGAVDAMAFDSGGSATLVSRVLGDESASLLNVPSDGRERPVADGVFVYSDAPAGGQPQLFARPAQSLALGGATIGLRGAVVDAAGHLLREVQLPALVADPLPGEHAVTLRDGPLVTTVRYQTVERIAKLSIEPSRPNPDPGESIPLRVHAYDALGNSVALDAVQWSAAGGAVTGSGAAAVYRAGSADGVVGASAGGLKAGADVRVGRHVQVLPFFRADASRTWQFATAPKGGAGALSFEAADAGEGDVLELPYDLSAVRAAYATGDFVLPGEPLAFELEAFGDESGVGLRAAFVNRLGERKSLTLAKSVDWAGWRRLVVPLPPDLNPPVHLASLYVVRLGQAPLRTNGVIRMRYPAVTLAGSSR